jgi:hypothetical protein
MIVELDAVSLTTRMRVAPRSVARTIAVVASAVCLHLAAAMDADDPHLASAAGHTVGLAAPTLVDPPPGDVLENVADYPPSAHWFFSWRSVTGATRYHVVVASPSSAQPGLDIVLDAGEGTTTCFRHYPQCHTHLRFDGRIPDSAAHGWHWRVRAGTEAAWSPWSERRDFEVASNGAGAGTALAVSAPVSGWPFGEARALGYWDPTMPPVVQGSIDGSGSFSAILPPLDLGASLRVIEPTIAVGPLQIGDARTVVIGWWALSDDAGHALGVVTMSTPNGRRVLANPAETRRGDAAAVWWYADADLTVRGSDMRSGVEFHYVLDLIPGWNLVVLRTLSGAEGLPPVLIEVSTTESLPESITWRWAPRP